MKQCVVPGCQEPIKNRSMCWGHYAKLRRYGDPLGGEWTRGTPIAERFWGKVAKGAQDECWPFGGSKVNGYGSFRIRPKSWLAHRVAWMLTYGEPVPPFLDHTCHNNTSCSGGPGCPHRACCNPAHLESVTIGENTRRSANTRTGENVRKSECNYGHPFDEANTWVDKKGRRHCRKCARRVRAESYHRHRNRVLASRRARYVSPRPSRWHDAD